MLSLREVISIPGCVHILPHTERRVCVCVCALSLLPPSQLHHMILAQQEGVGGSVA